MLASLVKMVRDPGIVPLADGIELAGDREICRRMGFQFGQGFYYAYPLLPKRLVASGSLSNRESTQGGVPQSPGAFA